MVRQIIKICLKRFFYNKSIFCVDSESQRETKKYETKFRSEWKAKFIWLQEQPNLPQGKLCKFCNDPIAGGLTHIERHAERKAHKAAESAAHETPDVTTYVDKLFKESSSAVVAKRLEVRLSAFVAEHNLSFAIMDHLSALLKSTITDSEIVKKL